MKLFFFIVSLLASFASFGQSKKNERYIHSGNEYYNKQSYAKAAEEYTKAITADPLDPIAKFNQANAIFKQDQKVEAAKLYSTVIGEANNKDLRGSAYYNKGVVLTREKNLEESIEAYKNALRNNPLDKEARENLQKALLELKKKPPPPKKEENKNNKNQQQQQQKQPQSKMSPKESSQRLQLLQQKEKEVQQRIQNAKSRTGGSQPRDW